MAAAGEVIEIEKWGISAAKGQKIQEFSNFLEKFLFGEILPSGPSVLNLNARHRQALEQALSGLDRACEIVRDLRQTTAAADVIAFELREVSDSLNVLCGAVTTEDLLGRVFAQFCIGK